MEDKDSMGQVFSIIAATVFVGVLYLISDYAFKGPDLNEKKEQRAIDIIDGVKFVKHQKSGICFAVNTFSPQPVFSNVDCNQIPEEDLLITYSN